MSHHFAVMAHRKEISTALWKRIHPLIPVVPPSPKGGRPRVDDQSALSGIVYVLRTGIAWEDLPPGTWLRQRHDLLAPIA